MSTKQNSPISASKKRKAEKPTGPAAKPDDGTVKPPPPGPKVDPEVAAGLKEDPDADPTIDKDEKPSEKPPKGPSEDAKIQKKVARAIKRKAAEDKEKCKKEVKKAKANDEIQVPGAEEEYKPIKADD